MFGIENSANNFGRSAGLLSNTAANLPLRAALGTLFIASDTLVIYRWTGTGWVTIGGGGGAFNGAENGLDVNFNNKVVLGGTLVQNTQISGNNAYLIKFDDYTQFAIGNNIQPSLLLDTPNSKISTSYNGSIIGLSLDFANNNYYLGNTLSASYIFVSPTSIQFGEWNNGTNCLNASINDGGLSLGDIAGVINGTYLQIDAVNSLIKTSYQGNDIGLKLDFNNGFYKLGDYFGLVNNTKIILDDGLQRINLESGLGLYNFANIPVYANNAAALAGGLIVGDIYRHSGGTGEQLHIVF